MRIVCQSPRCVRGTLVSAGSGSDEARIGAGRDDLPGPDRSDRRRLVDERDLDLVGADDACVDVRVRAGAGRVVKERDELREGAVWARVVLDLHQTCDVRGERDERADLLRRLPIELGARRRASRCGEAAADAVAVEVVEDIEGCDACVPADGIWCGCARIRRGERHRTDWLQAVSVEPVVEDARDARRRVTRAKRVRR